MHRTKCAGEALHVRNRISIQRRVHYFSEIEHHEQRRTLVEIDLRKKDEANSPNQMRSGKNDEVTSSKRFK